MSLQKELSDLLNKWCAENKSDTPDFILAAYLRRCIDAFDEATLARDAWYSRLRECMAESEVKGE